MTISESPIFDSKDMLERLGGDRELMFEVIGMFLEESPGLLEAIRQAVKLRDPGSLRMAAHTMKGALLNMSANVAAAQASEIEAQARRDHLEGTADLVSHLEANLGRLEDELELIVAQQ